MQVGVPYNVMFFSRLGLSQRDLLASHSRSHAGNCLPGIWLFTSAKPALSFARGYACCTACCTKKFRYFIPGSWRRPFEWGKLLLLQRMEEAGLSQVQPGRVFRTLSQGAEWAVLWLVLVWDPPEWWWRESCIVCVQRIPSWLRVKRSSV